MDKLDFKEIFNSLQTLNLNDLVEIEKNLLNGLSTGNNTFDKYSNKYSSKKMHKILTKYNNLVGGETDCSDAQARVEALEVEIANERTKRKEARAANDAAKRQRLETKKLLDKNNKILKKISKDRSAVEKLDDANKEKMKAIKNNLAKLKRGKDVLSSNRKKLKASREEVERRIQSNGKEMKKLQAMQRKLDGKINKYEEMKNKIVANEKKRAEESRQALLVLKNKSLEVKTQQKKLDKAQDELDKRAADNAKYNSLLNKRQATMKDERKEFAIKIKNANDDRKVFKATLDSDVSDYLNNLNEVLSTYKDKIKGHLSEATDNK